MPGDVTSRIVEFVRAVSSAMGMRMEVSVEETSDATRVVLAGDDGDLLVRRRGEALDALQHIVNTAFRKHLRDDRRIVVDCLDFRKGKDAELRQMAVYLAEKAKSSGVPQEIGPLNPYSRRIVHLAIAEDPSVSSESVGDAFMKTVIIAANKR